jgi:hypothetical protein
VGVDAELPLLEPLGYLDRPQRFPVGGVAHISNLPVDKNEKNGKSPPFWYTLKLHVDTTGLYVFDKPPE